MAAVVLHRRLPSRVTGGARVPNEEIAAAAAANPDVLIPFASIDPARGRAGVREVRRLVDEHGVRGFKFHPNLQAFFPNDRERLPALRGDRRARRAGAVPHRHTGIGAGLPGGGGIRLKYSNPMYVDDVAADFPELQIVLAHPSFPWQDEALSVAPAQAGGVHRPVRLVAEVLPAAARPVREHAAAATRCCSAPTTR